MCERVAASSCMLNAKFLYLYACKYECMYEDALINGM